MSKRFLMISIVAVVIVTAAITAYYMYSPNAERIAKFRLWMNNPASNPDWRLVAGSQCGSAPFDFPKNTTINMVVRLYLFPLEIHRFISACSRP